MVSVRVAVDNGSLPAPVRVGEGPHWDAGGRLHWVDILAGSLHTSDPASGRTNSVTLPTLLGAAVPRRTGGFVVATATGFGTVDGHGELDPRLDILAADARMNDAKCDPLGRLWAGSTERGFAPGRGVLHVLLPDWTTYVVWEGLTLPNGLGWSPDGGTFYLVDTLEGEISAFDTDAAATGLTRRRLLRRFPTGAGMPDGLTVDAAGCLWVALWGGNRLVQISPDGDLLTEVPLPVAQPSSCVFGGEALDTLYVTTAREGLSLSEGDPDGSVFCVHGLGVVGSPGEQFAG